MRIAQVLLHDAWGGINPEQLDKGIGGREGALIRLSAEWAKSGHQVTNYVTIDKPVIVKEGEGFHEYVHWKVAAGALMSFEYDAVVAWECPSVFADQRIKDRQRVRLVEMQCAALSAVEHLNVRNATGMICLSQWAKDYMVHQSTEMHSSQIHVLPNCIDLKLYPDPGDAESRRTAPKSFIYSSSPDRGLVHLLDMWPRILSRWPEAQLKVAYGMDRWLNIAKWRHYKDGEMAVRIEGSLNQQGIVNVGKIGQEELARYQRASTAMLYPCDPIQPTETGCITALEAMAAGSPVITTDADCLDSEFGDAAEIVPLPVEEEFVERVEAVLGDADRYAELAVAGRKLAETRQWKDVAPKWIELFRSERS